MPYNGKIFCVAEHYKEVFDEKRFQIRKEYHLGEETYKIKYELNILPWIGMFFGDDG